jgi:predicted lipoprotein with Yx(FWY)xxD motif
MRRVAAIAVLALALVGLASAATTSVAVVKVAYNARLHSKILVNGSGMTLYMYTADYGKVSGCVDDTSYHCIRAWPALLTTGRPKAGAGARASLLATAKRQDGRGTQVMYGGHLLYTYAGATGLGLPPRDRKPGDVNGQGVISAWWVLSPAGKPIKKTS